jgi:hypothetical protein
MKSIRYVPLLACSLLFETRVVDAGQIEAHFNDMFLGDTRTRTNTGSPNNGNLNRGSGFLPDNGSADGGPGEYNNDTGVLQFIAGDLAVPPGVAGFVSLQPPSGTSPTGVSMSHLAGGVLAQHRIQERHFASPLLGSQIWFSFLVRMDGPEAEGRVYFNAPVLTGGSSSSNGAGAFGITFGGPATPGAFAINLAPAADWRISNIFTIPASGVMYYDDLDGNNLIDGTETDRNGNGQIDGVEVGKANVANITSHLVICRVTVDGNPGGADTIDMWLDPANVSSMGALGAPTLTTVSDEIDATGIFSVAFAGWRNPAPSLSVNTYVSGGKASIDHFRMSDLANAFDFITGNVQADPKLAVQTTGDPNFNFAGVFGAGVPLSSATRTVILKNEGATQDIVINSISFQNGNAAGVFRITSQPILPMTLNPGESTGIEMVASSSVFATTFNDTLVVNTDEDAPFPQDASLAVAATFYTAGSRVNLNPGFDVNQNNWQDDAFATSGQGAPPRVLPGLNGTAAMIRMRGTGDTFVGAPDNYSQPVLNGASNFEFAFMVSPVAKGEFPKYVGFGGDPMDRSFQVILQSDSNVPQPASGTEGTWAEEFNNDAAMINLAYLPASDDLAIWDASLNGGLGAWEPLNLGPLSGSVDVTPPPVVTTDTDADNLDDAWEQIYSPGDLTVLNGIGNADFDTDGLTDRQEFLRGFSPVSQDTDADGIDDPDDHSGNGRLDPATGDTVNWHLIRIKGTGFGTGAASYTVSVSNPNATSTKSITAPLTRWATKSGLSNTPGGYTFNTRDVTNGSGNFGSVKTSSYWIDEVNYFSVQAPDPGMDVQDLPTILAHNSPTGSGLLTVRNTGYSSDLTVTGVNFAPGTAFSTAQTFPLVIPASGSAAIPITVNGAAIPLPNNAVREVATVVSNAFPESTVQRVFTASVTSNANLLGNWNFETPGGDPFTNFDSFSIWGGDGQTVLDSAGLVAGSTTSARIVGAATLANTLAVGANAFEIRFPFTMQTPGAGSDRLFNLQLRTVPSLNGTEEINLRISSTTPAQVQMFNGAAWDGFGTSFTPALSVDANGDGDFDDVGDSKNVYTMVLNGAGWASAEPTISVKLIGPDGSSVLVDLQGLTMAQAFRDKTDVLTSPLGLIQFLSTSGTPRFSVDDVSAMLVLTGDPGVVITGITGGPGSFTLNWDSGGAPVTVARSIDLLNWTNISENDADATHTDTGAPAGRAFYRVWIP